MWKEELGKGMKCVWGRLKIAHESFIDKSQEMKPPGISRLR
jgi:hypothetical protein